MGGAAIAVTRAPPRDQITACTQGVKPAMQTYIVADRSDRWTDNQTSLLRAALAGIARNAAVDERLTLVPFDGFADRPPVPLFDKCKSAETVTGFAMLFSTPARVEKAHQENFVKPLEATLAAITKPSQAKETHLAAFLANLAGAIQYEQRATKTRIVLLSDLAENTPELSVYAKARGQFTPEVFTKYFQETVRDRLSGITLEILRLPPPGHSSDLEKRIIAAWKTALTSAGVEFSIRDF